MLFLKEEVELNPTELAVYQYINTNLDKVVYMRIRELANETFVSTSTILRFCRKFGCQGYADFKVKLVEYKKGLDIKHESNLQSHQTQVLDFFKSTHTKKLSESMNEAIRIILESDLLFFLGTGTSGIMAEYGSTLFSSLFTFSCVIKEPKNTPEYFFPDYLDSHVCFIVIAQDDCSQEINDYIKKIYNQNIKVISISNGKDEELLDLSDINIIYDAKIEIYDQIDISSQIPVMHIIEKLSRQVYFYRNQQKI